MTNCGLQVWGKLINCITQRGQPEESVLEPAGYRYQRDSFLVFVDASENREHLAGKGGRLPLSPPSAPLPLSGQVSLASFIRASPQAHIAPYLPRD